MIVAVSRIWRLMALLMPLGALAPQATTDPSLPPFGRDTVLVYRSSNEKEGPFIVRIATFAPDRYIEWEDATTQGTVFMPAKLVSEARALVNYQLFEAGVDTRGKDATTLWISQRIFQAMKGSSKIKFMIDGLPATVTMLGNDHLSIEVNRTEKSLPVIKTKDDRGAERWFLDNEENPLLVNLQVRNYRQQLASITTDRANTLRWTKDKKK
jgi:hypothetical protein